MRYASGSAFRQALEERLRAQSLSTYTPLVRLRRLVAFDRFLARLVADQGERWILKGGLALQLRLGARARTTQDVDLLLISPSPEPDLHQVLVESALRPLDDWFEFHVRSVPESRTPRYPVQCLVDGRTFEGFPVDVGTGDPVIETPDLLEGPALLAFADIAPARVPCYPLTQQIAEKVHALSRPYATGETTRIKDWVDILLMAEVGSLEARLLRRAMEATFAARRTHPLPARLPAPPERWEPAFREVSREVSLGVQSLAAATDRMRGFLDPVLLGTVEGTWDPGVWAWL